jgi:hypothetical protein
MGGSPDGRPWSATYNTLGGDKGVARNSSNYDKKLWVQQKLKEEELKKKRSNKLGYANPRKT